MVRLSGCRRAERAESGRKRKRIGTFGRRGGAKDLIGAAVVARGMTVDVIIIGGRPLVRGIVEGGHSEWWHRRRGRREFSHGLHRRRGLARSPSESRAAGRAQGAALARGGRREWRCVNWLLHLGLTMCGGLYQASGRAIFFTPVTLSAPFGSRTQSPTESRGLVISARYTLTPQLSTAGSQSGHRTVYHAEPRGPPCREHTEGGPRSKKCTRIPSTLYQHSGLPDERGFGVGVPHCRRP